MTARRPLRPLTAAERERAAEHREAWAEVLDAVARADREPLATDRLNAPAVAARRAQQLAAHHAGRGEPWTCSTSR